MRLFSMGPTELVIIAAILLIMFIPSVLAAVGMYRIAKRIGYEDGASTLWAVGYIFIGWVVVLILGFIEWPRDHKTPLDHPVPDIPPVE